MEIRCWVIVTDVTGCIVQIAHRFSSVFLLNYQVTIVKKFAATAPRRNRYVVTAVDSAVGFILSLAIRAVSSVIIALKMMKQPYNVRNAKKDFAVVAGLNLQVKESKVAAT